MPPMVAPYPASPSRATRPSVSRSTWICAIASKYRSSASSSAFSTLGASQPIPANRSRRIRFCAATAVEAQVVGDAEAGHVVVREAQVPGLVAEDQAAGARMQAVRADDEVDAAGRTALEGDVHSVPGVGERGDRVPEDVLDGVLGALVQDLRQFAAEDLYVPAHHRKPQRPVQRRHQHRHDRGRRGVPSSVRTSRGPSIPKRISGILARRVSGYGKKPAHTRWTGSVQRTRQWPRAQLRRVSARPCRP